MANMSCKSEDKRVVPEIICKWEINRIRKKLVMNMKSKWENNRVVLKVLVNMKNKCVLIYL